MSAQFWMLVGVSLATLILIVLEVREPTIAFDHPRTIAKVAVFALWLGLWTDGDPVFWAKVAFSWTPFLAKRLARLLE